MRDLAVIVPTRGRPWHIQRLADAMQQTCLLQTDLIAMADDDDPRLEDYRSLGLAALRVGERDTPAALSNAVALEAVKEYRFVASYGDDHVPRTEGWDKELCGEIDAMGGTGFAYGAGSRWVVPEGVVVSSDIVSALGWLYLPGCGHYKVDDAWLQLGLTAGCIRYRPDVLVEHMQFGIPIDPLDPEAGFKAIRDRTYAEELVTEKINRDVIAWHQWQDDPGGLIADAAKIRALIEVKR